MPQSICTNKIGFYISHNVNTLVIFLNCVNLENYINVITTGKSAGL